MATFTRTLTKGGIYVQEMYSVNYCQKFYILAFDLYDRAREIGSEAAVGELRVSKNEMPDRVNAVMKDLTYHQRRILHEVLRQGADFKHLGHILGMSPGLTKKIYDIAVRKIRSLKYRRVLLGCEKKLDEMLAKYDKVTSIDDIGIDRLDLSDYAVGKLDDAGIGTVGDLRPYFSEGFNSMCKKLQTIPGIGPKSAEEIIHALEDIGIVGFAMGLPFPESDEERLQDLRNLAIGDYGKFSTRLRHTLERNDFVTVGDLVDLFEDSVMKGFLELSDIPGIGPKSRYDIFNTLRDEGFFPANSDVTIGRDTDIYYFGLDEGLTYKLALNGVFTVGGLINLCDNADPVLGPPELLHTEFLRAMDELEHYRLL